MSSVRGATRAPLVKDWIVFYSSAQVGAGELVVADRHDVIFPVRETDGSPLNDDGTHDTDASHQAHI